MDSHDISLPVGQVEARSVAFTDLDVTKQGRHFDGYAAVYGQEFDTGKFIEVMVPPAFRSALAKTPNLPMLWHHNDQLPPFATTGAGTLEVEEDRRGLRVQADIDERHLLGPTLMSMIERGEVRGMSIGFITERGDNKVSQRSGRLVRTITGFKKLLDVSPTWEPAYEGTSAELRSLTAAFQQVPVLIPEQVHDGESQSAVDGPDDQETTGVTADTVCETCGKLPEGDDACSCVPEGDSASEVGEQLLEEQRSGADSAEAERAARTRRLQMMGLSLPR